MSVNVSHETIPESVAIVAMGQSSGTYMALCANRGDRHRVADETWAINSMGSVIDHDLLFHMDDCKVQESRAKADPTGGVAGMVSWLKDHPRFITSTAYPGYPGAIEFPLEDVVNMIRFPYLNSTSACAVAYAMCLGIKKLRLYGMDFTYPNWHQGERGRGCVEFLLGIAWAMQTDIEIAGDSQLMDACVATTDRFYGYEAWTIDMKDGEDGRIQIIKTSRGTLPEPEEMERKYCRDRREPGQLAAV